MGRCPCGSDLLDELTAYCKKEHISCGMLEVIGAVRKARFGYYNQQDKEYHFHEMDTRLEILNCTGTISLDDDTPMVHAHITFADDHGRAFGGHLSQGTIVFAAEFIIQSFDTNIFQRKYDEVTGLKLWKD